ncbi:DUF1963 domain-containing protein [Brevibacterium sp. UMB10442]|nr:DUF1963 domain-containing protein [Brevibacterium sp. UMB10442]
MSEFSAQVQALRSMIESEEFISEDTDGLIQLAKPAVTLPYSSCTPTEHGSYFGGRPYLPEGATWPIAKSGQPLLHIVQLNFADIVRHVRAEGASESEATLDGLIPDSGIFQLFVGADPLYGGFTSDSPGDGMEIRYIPEPAEGFGNHSFPGPHTAEPAAFDEQDEDYCSPFSKDIGTIMNAPISLSSAAAMIPPTEQAVYEAWESEKDDDFLDNDEYFDELVELRSAARNQSDIMIGGFPAFAQDPSEPDGYVHFLEIDSTYLEEEEELPFEAMWGDLGVAHVFLHPAALKKMHAGEAVVYRSENTGTTDGAVFYWDQG